MIEFLPADQRAAEREERFVDVGAAVVADAQAPLLVQPTQRAFHDPAVHAQTAAVLGAAFGDHRLDAALTQRGAMPGGVVPAVGIQPIRLATRPAHAARDWQKSIDQRQQLRHVVPVCRGQANAEWRSLRIGDDVVFRAGFPPIRRVGAGFFAPPTARSDALSTTARRQSIWSAPLSLASNTRWSLRQTPAACQSRRRRQQVIPAPQPISCGRSSQGIPVLSTKRMPVIAGRSATRGRPPLGLGGSGGMSGSRISHSSSGTSGLAIAVSSVTPLPVYLFGNRWPSSSGFVRRSKHEASGWRNQEKEGEFGEGLRMGSGSGGRCDCGLPLRAALGASPPQVLRCACGQPPALPQAWLTLRQTREAPWLVLGPREPGAHTAPPFPGRYPKPPRFAAGTILVPKSPKSSAPRPL